MESALDTSPVNLDEGLARAGGDLEFYRELVGLFLADAAERIESLKAGLAAGNAQQVTAAAHGIKGAAANLSAYPTREAAYTIEVLGRRGELDGVGTLVTTLEAEIGRLSAVVAKL